MILKIYPKHTRCVTSCKMLAWNLVMQLHPGMSFLETHAQWVRNRTIRNSVLRGLSQTLTTLTMRCNSIGYENSNAATRPPFTPRYGVQPALKVESNQSGSGPHRIISRELFFINHMWKSENTGSTARGFPHMLKYISFFMPSGRLCVFTSIRLLNKNNYVCLSITYRLK